MSTTYPVNGRPTTVDDFASTSVAVQNTGAVPLYIEPLGRTVDVGATVTVPGWSTRRTRVRTAGQDGTAVVTLTAGTPAAGPGPGGVTFDPGPAASVSLSISGGTWYSNEGLTTAVSFPVSLVAPTVLYPAAPGSITVTAVVGGTTQVRGMNVNEGSAEAFTWVPSTDAERAAAGVSAGTGTYGQLWATPAASTTLTGTLAAWTVTSVDCTAGAGARSLPAANSVVAGTAFVAKKGDTSNNALVVSRAGSDLIYGTGAGSATKTLTLPGEAVEFVSNGIDKYTVRASDTPSSAIAGAYVARAGLNLDAQSLRKWRRAMAKVRAGTADARVLCCGDSTTAGVGVASSTNQGDIRSYPYQLAARLNGRGVNSLAGLGIPGHTANTDSRWSLGTGWANDVVGAGANSAYKYTSGGGNLTCTPGVVADTYDVYFISTPGVGSANASATGGSSVAVNYNQANLVRKVTVTAASASASNVVTIAPVSGLGWIVGVEPRLSTAKAVLVGNAGCGSSTTTQWASNPGGVEAYGSVGLIKSYAPDLTIFSLGLNEASAGNVSLYASNLATLITAAQISGDVMIMPPIPNAAGMSGATTGKSAGVAAFTAACRGLSLPYVALDDRWASGDQANSDGYMWDYQHPNEVGYADIAQMISNVLVAL